MASAIDRRPLPCIIEALDDNGLEAIQKNFEAIFSENTTGFRMVELEAALALIASGSRAFVIVNSDGTVSLQSSAIPVTDVTPGGADTEVQFNNAGVLDGDPGLTYNLSTDALTLAGNLIVDTTTLFVDTAANKVGINTASPLATLQVGIDQSGAGDIMMNGGAFKFRSNMLHEIVVEDANSSANLAITGGGHATSSIALRSTYGVGTTDHIRLLVGNNGGTEGIRVISSGNVGVKTATPGSALSINGGLHVGGDSDAGDNNLLVDGTLTVTGAVTLTSNLQYSSLVPATAASVLVGRGSAAGAGDFQELTIGAGLTMTGTVLSAAGGTVAGSDTQVQFNDGGAAFGGDAGLVYNKTTDALTVGGTVNNMIIGYSGGAVNTNTAFGVSALDSNTTGATSVAIGYNALTANTIGASNVAVGYSALAVNTDGTLNTAVGVQALGTNASGVLNTAFGYHALIAATASHNTVVGAYAGQALTSGDKNTAVGHEALYTDIVGAENVAIGRMALNLATGRTNVAVGYGSGAAITTGDYNVVLGGYDGTAIATLSNRIILADGQGNTRMAVDNNGNVGIGVTAPLSTSKGLDIASGSLGLLIGADINTSTRTDATTKVARFGVPHYTNAEEPVAMYVVANLSAVNDIAIGGGSGLMNAATDITLYTAANNTTVTGTARLGIDSAGAVYVAKGLHVGGTSDAGDNNLLVDGFLSVGTGAVPATALDVMAADNTTAVTIKINATQANITAADKYVSFTSQTGEEANVIGTGVLGVIAYNTFTGAHKTLVGGRAPALMLLLEMTGERITKEDFTSLGTSRDDKYTGPAPKEFLPRTRVCETKGSKACFGVYAGADEYGIGMALALGTGWMMVTNTGSNLQAGDYLISSDVPGHAELQLDDIKRASTVASVSAHVQWGVGEVSRQVAVRYLMG